ncbi:2,3-dihydro-2,3-dihydroxybenzoate dehydrogenase [Paenibacillus bouchesdurhonensis]|uniref:2,3-dihydro-2,3-dihydroxybenzoate dehydrogenase n=1 Tax=Paenibacillus bouchesdurhonensis TaxID=1870990 RepID=UPI000DA603C0|nr:2,3-dihydro-2,3-dihydroxybenzoate dehydrogenase [Paenibacillus bouchesdurhonensis]
MEHAGIKGKVALVTGAAQGIGEAVVRALAEAGAIVAAVDLNGEAVASLTNELLTRGSQAAAFAVDVADSRAVEAVVGRIEQMLGPIEILVNVAGILRIASVEELRDEDWAAVFAVNANGVFHVSRSVVKRMALRQSGSIVTVGSNAGAVPRMHMSAYCASKAAAAMFTKCLGLEQASNHIRCNIVSPGSTDTAMQRKLWNDPDGPQSVIAGTSEAFRLGIPLGRIAEPSDIADAVMFLASDKARHITMLDLCIDGGATLGG